MTAIARPTDSLEPIASVELAALSAARFRRPGIRGLIDDVRASIEHPANPSIDVVSVSIGATLIDDDQLGLSDEQWFWVVDRAMYAAKAAGRNQVRLGTGIAA